MPQASSRENLVTLGFALWILAGLLLDTYAHSTSPQLETFWTPWHAVFYSGYVAMSAWIASMLVRRLRPGGRLLDACPAGYGVAVLGLGIFAVGGIGDAIWHSMFGIETSIDALFSPSHLLLAFGMVLILSTPLRAQWRGNEPWGSTPRLRVFGVALTSLALSSTMLAITAAYAWAPILDRQFAQPYRNGVGKNEAVLAVVSVILTTLMLFGPLLVISQRWRLPFGTATIVLGFVAVAVPLGLADTFMGVPALIVGGLFFDVLIRLRTPRLVLAALPPLVLWVVFFATVTQTSAGLGLAAEFIGGAIVLSAVATMAVHGVQAAARNAAIHALSRGALDPALVAPSATEATGANVR